MTQLSSTSIALAIAVATVALPAIAQTEAPTKDSGFVEVTPEDIVNPEDLLEDADETESSATSADPAEPEDTSTEETPEADSETSTDTSQLSVSEEDGADVDEPAINTETEPEDSESEVPAPSGNAEQLQNAETDKPAPRELTSADVTDEQVTQLAQALLAIRPLLVRADAEIRSAESPDKQKEIEQTFEAEAIALVQKEGLTTEKYRELLILADRDPEFERRVSEQLDSLQGGVKLE